VERFFFEEKKDLAGCFIIERLADSGILLLAGTYGLILFREYTGLLVIVTLIIVVGIVILINVEKILNFFLRRDIFHEKWFRERIEKVNLSNWLLFVLNSLVLWFIGILGQYIMAKSFGFTIPMLLLIRISALTVITGMLSGLPGGLGISQLTFTHLAVLYSDVSKELIGVFMTAMLTVMYAVNGVLGMIGLAIIHSKR